MFARPAGAAEADAAPPAPVPGADAAAKRPPAWSLSNWPVGWKVLAIVLVPLILVTVFGVLRIHTAMDSAARLKLAATRADVVPVITKYMSALDVALQAGSAGRDVEGAKKNYEARKGELQGRLADTDVTDDVRSGVNTLLDAGQMLVSKASDSGLGLRERVTLYAPILLTAEDVINASVRVDDEHIRAQAQGLSRAVGARGQMTMQKILITRGAELPEPQLRTSMATLAGTEPSTLFGMSEVLGAGSPEAKTLQQQMVARMAIMSDPASVLVDNADLLRSVQATDDIADQVIKNVTASVTKAVHAQAADRRSAAIVDTVLVLAAIVIALVVVLLVARALVRPLRILRDGALKVAHTDLEDEVARVKAGGAEPIPTPLPVYTTEEIGQVAHAVDELHTQALLLAGDEARLRLLVNDMFETMSRRSRSLVDQQLALIDRLERNEENPERLDSLFRLDHLAARLRRNSANLLVLAGAQLARDQRDPVPLATVISAAVSEVEDYRRVEIAGLPECALVGAAAGGAIHLFAELIDNALRYSPPTTSVRVSASRSGSDSQGGVVVRIADSGLGMNDADRRIANMRLQSGGDVSPDNARHMGLFVVGRIAGRHGIRVGLRGPAANEKGTGTTAEIYLPPTVLTGLAAAESAAPRHIRAVSSPSAKLASAIAAPPPADDARRHDGAREPRPQRPAAPSRRSPCCRAATRVPAASPTSRPRPPNHRPRGGAASSRPPGGKTRPRPRRPPGPASPRPHRSHHRRPSPRPSRRRLRRCGRHRTPRPSSPPGPANPGKTSPPTRRPTMTSSTGGCSRRCWATRTTWSTAPTWTGSRSGTAAGRWRRPPRTSPSKRTPPTTACRSARPAPGWCPAAPTERVWPNGTSPSTARTADRTGSRSTRPSPATPRRCAPRSATISAACVADARMPVTRSKDPTNNDLPRQLTGLAGDQVRPRGPRRRARAAGVRRRAAHRRQRAPAQGTRRPAGRRRLRAGQPGDRCRAAVRGRAGAAVGRRDGQRLPAVDARRGWLASRDARRDVVRHRSDRLRDGRPRRTGRGRGAVDPPVRRPLVSRDGHPRELARTP
ncbi:histidine kinase-, DNA gyrase B-, and HSP90-like ATPase family protein [Mycobacterium intracellulare MIN_052511_1280]|nr:histidine kinase-, DNA gyrase B-, and HSP90-like ATPase family protein [Mycobacterium intracellulare MIN_052511_1280]